MPKRIVALLVCICILAVAASCNTGGTSPSAGMATTQQTSLQSLGTGTLSLAFSASDSLNPYTAVTKVNKQLTALLFDPLVKLDEQINPALCLAKSAVVEGNKCIVTLNDAQFSDGTAVTADDVVYSLNLAQEAENTIFPQQLANIASCGAASSTVVEFTLRTEDPNVIRLLDFPIMKTNSENRQNADKKALPPIGCGRYVYQDDNGSYSLIPNENYFGVAPENNVRLVNVPDTAAWQYALKAGEADICYSGIDLDDVPSMRGGVSRVAQTDFVFLGLNENVAQVSDIYIKKAIFYLLNRKEFCDAAYYSYAIPATSPFTGQLDFAADTAQEVSETGDLQAAQQQLALAEYTSKDSSGFYRSDAGTLQLTLLYNTDNANHALAATLLQEQFKKSGIKLELSGTSGAEYAKRVADGQYMLYLGEIKLNKNFDLTNMLGETMHMPATTQNPENMTTQAQTDVTGNAALATTQPVSTAVPQPKVDIAALYQSYLAGQTTIETFMEGFYTDLPFIPICHRLGVLHYSDQVTPAATASVSDAYYNITTLSVS